MGLKMNTTGVEIKTSNWRDYGIDSTEAYIRIEDNPDIKHTSKSSACHYKIWTTKALKDAGNMPLAHGLISVQDEAIFNTYFAEAVLKEVDKSPRIQWYAYMKTLAEFATATDA